MTVQRYKPFEHIASKQKLAAQYRENSARLAHTFGTFETTGWGEYAPEDAIEFDAPYLYRPSVTYGSSLLDDDVAEELRTTRFPRCSGTVLRWDRTAGGLYTRAWVVIVVEDRSALIEPTDPDPDPNYAIVHDFVFLGIATKDLPSPTKSGPLKEV